MLRRCLFAAGLFAAVLAAPVSVAGEPEQDRSYWVAADITIAADGSISTLDWHSSDKLSRSEIDELEPIVREWQFQPGQLEGQPAETETTLHVSLEGRARDNGRFALVVDDAWTGASLGSRQPPLYPAAAKRREVSAKVRLELGVDASGHARVEIVDYVASDDRAIFRRLFEQAVNDAALEWKVEPERVAGRAVASRLRTSISFCLDDDWCQLHSLPSVATTADVPTRPGEALPLDSVTELLSDVEGEEI